MEWNRRRLEGERGMSPTSQNRLTTHYRTPCAPVIDAQSRARTPVLGVCRCTCNPRSNTLPPFALATGTANQVMNHTQGRRGSQSKFTLGPRGDCRHAGSNMAWVWEASAHQQLRPAVVGRVTEVREHDPAVGGTRCGTTGRSSQHNKPGASPWGHGAPLDGARPRWGVNMADSENRYPAGTRQVVLPP